MTRHVIQELLHQVAIIQRARDPQPQRFRLDTRSGVRGHLNTPFGDQEHVAASEAAIR